MRPIQFQARVFACFFLGVSFAHARDAIVLQDNVKLFKRASSNSRCLRVLSTGDRVDATDEKTGYYRIQFGPEIGWVHQTDVIVFDDASLFDSYINGTAPLTRNIDMPADLRAKLERIESPDFYMGELRNSSSDVRHHAVQRVFFILGDDLGKAIDFLTAVRKTNDRTLWEEALRAADQTPWFSRIRHDDQTITYLLGQIQTSTGQLLIDRLALFDWLYPDEVNAKEDALLEDVLTENANLIVPPFDLFGRKPDSSVFRKIVSAGLDRQTDPAESRRAFFVLAYKMALAQEDELFDRRRISTSFSTFTPHHQTWILEKTCALIANNIGHLLLYKALKDTSSNAPYEAAKDCFQQLCTVRTEPACVDLHKWLGEILPGLPSNDRRHDIEQLVVENQIKKR